MTLKIQDTPKVTLLSNIGPFLNSFKSFQNLDHKKKKEHRISCASAGCHTKYDKHAELDRIGSVAPQLVAIPNMITTRNWTNRVQGGRDKVLHFSNLIQTLIGSE